MESHLRVCEKEEKYEIIDAMAVGVYEKEKKSRIIDEKLR